LLGAGGTTGIQNLSEFANVARNKLKISWAEVHEAVDQITTLCEVSI